MTTKTYISCLHSWWSIDQGKNVCIATLDPKATIAMMEYIRPKAALYEVKDIYVYVHPKKGKNKLGPPQISS
jgi:hypothetical protein